MSKNTERLALTEVELEFMCILWDLGSCTVAELRTALPESRALAYTSVSTILRILEKKQFVLSTADGRRHIYSPRIDKQSYEQASIDRIAESLFAGQHKQIVRAMVQNDQLSVDEIKELQNLLRSKLSTSKGAS